MLIREPSFAELSKTISVPSPSSSNGTVNSKVPRVPVPEVAVTKFSAMTRPSESVSSYWKFASNVLAVPVARNGLEIASNGSGDSTRMDGV